MKILASLCFAAFFALCQVDKTVSIHCIECRSSVSWEDCNRLQVVVNCSSNSNRCLTFHRIQTRSNGEHQHEYIKGCISDGRCNLPECHERSKSRDPDSNCNTECCNTTLCNKGVTQSSNEIPHLTPRRQQGRGINEVKNYLLKSEEKNEKSPKPLKCYDCSSPFSWEDCNRHQRLIDCPAQLNVCTTYHRVLTQHSGNQEHEYKKGCWHDKACSNEQCRRTNNDVKGNWCDMRCCASTQCNRGGIIEKRTGSLAMQVADSASVVEAHHFVLITLGAFAQVVSGFL